MNFLDKTSPVTQVSTSFSFIGWQIFRLMIYYHIYCLSTWQQLSYLQTGLLTWDGLYRLTIADIALPHCASVLRQEKEEHRLPQTLANHPGEGLYWHQLGQLPLSREGYKGKACNRNWKLFASRTNAYTPAAILAFSDKLIAWQPLYLTDQLLSHGLSWP